METQYCFYYFSLTYPLLRKKYHFYGFKETKSTRFVRRRSLHIPISPKAYIAENEFVGSCGLGTWVKGCGSWGIDITPTLTSTLTPSHPHRHPRIVFLILKIMTVVIKLIYHSGLWLWIILWKLVFSYRRIQNKSSQKINS